MLIQIFFRSYRLLFVVNKYKGMFHQLHFLDKYLVFAEQFSKNLTSKILHLFLLEDKLKKKKERFIKIFNFYLSYFVFTNILCIPNFNRVININIRISFNFNWSISNQSITFLISSFIINCIKSFWSYLFLLKEN